MRMNNTCLWEEGWLITPHENFNFFASISFDVTSGEWPMYVIDISFVCPCWLSEPLTCMGRYDVLWAHILLILSTNLLYFSWRRCPSFLWSCRLYANRSKICFCCVEFLFSTYQRIIVNIFYCNIFLFWRHWMAACATLSLAS